LVGGRRIVFAFLTKSNEQETEKKKLFFYHSANGPNAIIVTFDVANYVILGKRIHTKQENEGDVGHFE
jgi:hypothetical protein